MTFIERLEQDLKRLKRESELFGRKDARADYQRVWNYLKRIKASKRASWLVA